MGIQQNMGEVIGLLKKERGKSLAEFATELEISRSTLQEYIKGEGNPNLEMVEHLSQKLGIDPIALLTGVFEPTQQKIILLLLDTVRQVTPLPEAKRLRFAELFQEMLQLWEEEQ